MKKRLRHNLNTLFMYSAIIFLLLTPLFYYILITSFISASVGLILLMNAGISLILGFFAGMFNDIVKQLRMLNGEKFPNLEEDKEELIKS